MMLQSYLAQIYLCIYVRHDHNFTSRSTFNSMALGYSKVHDVIMQQCLGYNSQE